MVRLDGGAPHGEALAALHLGQDQVLARADVALHGLDLVEHGGVLLVGLDLHELALEARALGFQVLELGFVLPAGFLAAGQLLAGRLQASALAPQGRLQLRPLAGDLGQLGFYAAKIGLGSLEPDEPLEVGIHAGGWMSFRPCILALPGECPGARERCRGQAHRS